VAIQLALPAFKGSTVYAARKSDFPRGKCGRRAMHLLRASRAFSDFNELKTMTIQASLGIITSYVIFVGGYIITQILTPVVSGTGFYLENLIAILPNILSSGLLPAIIGGAVLPVTILSKKADFTIKDRFYYPTTIGVSILCWFIVIGSWFLINF